MVAYDRIGATYRNTRRPDPRIASQVRDALATMGTVVNVGAGTGSYEPGQTVAAIEPSMVMIAQRLPARRRVSRPWRRHCPCGTSALTPQWPC
nr:hypothetical protein [Mycobacterium intracellulare]